LYFFFVSILAILSCRQSGTLKGTEMSTEHDYVYLF
jgi:hypothetical protein